MIISVSASMTWTMLLSPFASAVSTLPCRLMQHMTSKGRLTRTSWLPTLPRSQELLNSAAYARGRGLVTVASPADKRLALSAVSLEVAGLSHTTDALHLSLLGGWTSCLMFRRPLMSILSPSFAVAPASQVVASRPKLCRLSREAAQELVLLAVLAPPGLIRAVCSDV